MKKNGVSNAVISLDLEYYAHPRDDRTPLLLGAITDCELVYNNQNSSSRSMAVLTVENLDFIAVGPPNRLSQKRQARSGPDALPPSRTQSGLTACGGPRVSTSAVRTCRVY